MKSDPTPLRATAAEVTQLQESRECFYDDPELVSICNWPSFGVDPVIAIEVG